MVVHDPQGATPTSVAPVPVITLDGPSGVGKGTVARSLARQLGWHRLDSGALYRLLALAAYDRQLPFAAIEKIAELAPRLDIRFVDTDIGDRVMLDEVDVTSRLREETTGGWASQLAVAPLIRQALEARQRQFRQRPGLIADGRDMGTVIFPDAALKIFLDASPQARALRRQAQLSGQGVTATLVDLCADIEARDRRDRERVIAPLKPAEDALTIDTTRLTPQEVVAAIGVLLTARGMR